MYNTETRNLCLRLNFHQTLQLRCLKLLSVYNLSVYNSLCIQSNIFRTLYKWISEYFTKNILLI